MAHETANAVGYVEVIEILVGSPRPDPVGRILKEPAPRRKRSHGNPRKGKPLCFIQGANRRIDDQQKQIDDHFPYRWDTEAGIGREGQCEKCPRKEQAQRNGDARPAERQSGKQQERDGQCEQDRGNGDGEKNRDWPTRMRATARAVSGKAEEPTSEYTHFVFATTLRRGVPW